MEAESTPANCFTAIWQVQSAMFIKGCFRRETLASEDICQQTQRQSRPVSLAASRQAPAKQQLAGLGLLNGWGGKLKAGFEFLRNHAILLCVLLAYEC
jgi:hypothetical protein